MVNVITKLIFEDSLFYHFITSFWPWGLITFHYFTLTCWHQLHFKFKSRVIKFSKLQMCPIDFSFFPLELVWHTCNRHSSMHIKEERKIMKFYWWASCWSIWHSWFALILYIDYMYNGVHVTNMIDALLKTGVVRFSFKFLFQQNKFGRLKPMDSFGMWWKSNEITFLHWIIIL